MTKATDQQATIGTMFSAAIARRLAGKPPASVEDDEAEEKAEPAPLNKMATAPANKAKKKVTK